MKTLILMLAVMGLAGCNADIAVTVATPQGSDSPKTQSISPASASTPEESCAAVLPELTKNQGTQGDTSLWALQGSCPALTFDKIAFTVWAPTGQNPFGGVGARVYIPLGADSYKNQVYNIGAYGSKTLDGANRIELDSYYSYSEGCNQIIIEGCVFNYVSTQGGY